jgi:hypothetical protein
LEFAVVFVMAVFLLVGMLSLWKWSSDRIIQRQILYNDSRVKAGTRSPAPVVTPQIVVKSGGGGYTTW